MGHPKWKISEKKCAGARVYAEFTNGDYYWGNIVQIRTSGNQSPPRSPSSSLSPSSQAGTKRYNVLFEDGDRLENLSDDVIFTEKEYLEYFDVVDMPPPRPHVDFDTLLVREEVSRDHNSLTNGSIESCGGNKMRTTGINSSQDAELPNVLGNDFYDSANDRKLPGQTGQEPCSIARRSEGNKGELNRMTPSMLYRDRCKACSACLETDCGFCTSCLRNRRRRWESREVCLRKMCFNIDPLRKAQPAIGFSTGWAFYFEDRRGASSLSTGSQTKCQGLRIIGPDGQKYSSIEAAARRDESEANPETRKQQFCAHLGFLSSQIDIHHVLIGRGYCREWTDVTGRNKIIFGVITSCSKTDEETNPIFTVKYDESACKFLNAFPNSFETVIERSQEIEADLAWGGCFCFERKKFLNCGKGSVIANLDRTTPCRHLVVPDMRREAMVENEGGKLPQLTLVVRGYQLVFSVKPSTIPNAGNGLFVKCTYFRNNIREKRASSFNSFGLSPGELLDLGVYAPFRSEDKKHGTVFNNKNYVFSMACEEWNFNSNDDDYIYDITDDKTGEVHEEARKHVLMYINECSSSNQSPSIHAELDPEGCVHYYLGTRYCGNWISYMMNSTQFDLRADGVEKEVFVDYGELYEDVRIRKGYSRKSLRHQKKVLAALPHNEAEYLRDILLNFDAKEVAESVKFFLEYCIPHGYYGQSGQGRRIDGEVRDRSMQVAVRLRTKAERLRSIVNEKQRQDLPPDIKPFDISHGIDLQEVVNASETLIQRIRNASCDRLIKDMEEYERLEIGNDVQNYSGSDSELRQTYYIMNTDSSSCGSSSSYSVQSGDSDESMSK